MSTDPVSLRQAHLDVVARRDVRVPAYDRAALRPRIAHLGVGGFHRAHLALYTDEAAARGGDWGIVGLGLMPEDAAMAEVLARQDHLYTLIEKGPGEPTARVVGSIIGFVHAPAGHDAQVAELLAAPETAILSMTITEAGYVEPAAGGAPTTFDRLAVALAARRDAGAGGLTILSCDNIQGNGDVARVATLAAAERAGGALAAWVREHCAFPNSMVDRITPVTGASDRAWLRDAHGVDDEWPVVAEPFRQWVVEDEFAAGRPAWEQEGVLFTAGVHDWELYKLRLLNAGHSSMAYLAALADLTFVDEAMSVAPVGAFVERLLYDEAIPILTPIPGHPREDYAASVLERFRNTGVRDQIQRLCIDGSAKFPTFLIPTVAAQLDRGGPIEGAATALAGWARYLAEVAPADQAFDASADVARRHAAEARAEPRAFLAYDEVFPAQLRESSRFADAFAAAYRRVADEGPIAAMTPAAAGAATGGSR